MSVEAAFTADEQQVIDGWAAFSGSLSGSLTGAARDVEATGTLAGDQVRDLAGRIAAGGWFHVAVPGTDLTLGTTTLAGLAEAGGRPRIPLPYPVLETWTAVALLSAAGDAVADVLDEVVGGEVVTTVAVDALGGSAPPGRSGWVPWGGVAGLVVVPLVRDSGTCDLHVLRPADLELHPATPLDVTAPGAWFPTGDLGRPLATLPAPDVAPVLAAHLVLQSAEMVGAAGALLQDTVHHLGNREQFGRALGSFQALRHRAADLFVSVETARSLTYWAGWTVEAGRPDAEEQAMMAKGFTGEAATRLGDDAIQLHGGAGFTWEVGLHFRVGRIIHRSLTARSSRDCLVDGGRRALRRGTMPGLV